MAPRFQRSGTKDDSYADTSPPFLDVGTVPYVDEAMRLVFPPRCDRVTVDVVPCTVCGMSDTDDQQYDARDDATRLGLAVIGEAAALHEADTESVSASEANLRDSVDELIDEPLTERQQDVVETLGTSSAALTAGLAGAVAIEQDRPVGEVLAGAARSIVMQQRMASEGHPESEDGE